MRGAVWDLVEPLHHVATDVQLYLVQLDPEPANKVLRWARTLLSIAEDARAARLVFARDHQRFVLARAALRCVLAERLGCDPANVLFDYGPYGKPRLQGSGSLHFNLSHSQGRALIGVSHRALGVDIEQLRPLEDFLGLAKHVHTPEEVAVLRAVPAKELTRAFFRAWVCKEAYMKALGTGFATPPTSFQVWFDTAENVSLHVPRQLIETTRWRLQLLHPEVGYLGALAVEAS